MNTRPRGSYCSSCVAPIAPADVPAFIAQDYLCTDCVTSEVAPRNTPYDAWEGLATEVMA